MDKPLGVELKARPGPGGGKARSTHTPIRPGQPEGPFRRPGLVHDCQLSHQTRRHPRCVEFQARSAAGIGKGSPSRARLAAPVNARFARAAAMSFPLLVLPSYLHSTWSSLYQSPHQWGHFFTRRQPERVLLRGPCSENTLHSVLGWEIKRQTTGS